MYTTFASGALSLSATTAKLWCEEIVTHVLSHTLTYLYFTRSCIIHLLDALTYLCITQTQLVEHILVVFCHVACEADQTNSAL